MQNVRPRRPFVHNAGIDAKRREPMDETQRQRIQSYVNLADREIEPVFVGRKDLFGTVASAASSCAEGHPRGQTVCLSGPPGIGKTAFLTELRRRGLDDWAGPPMLVADVDPWRLHDPRFVLERVAAAFAEHDKTWTRLRKWTRDTGGRVRSFSALGFGGGIDPKASTIDVLEAHLAKRLDGGPERFVLCLAVDEAQQLKPTPGGRANELLAVIHAGVYAKFPLFVLLAGLSQTPDVIRPSMSWLAENRDVRMQSLGRSDAKFYVQGVLDHVEAAGPSRRLVDWVMRECGGFPHHLRNAMTALGKEMLRAGSVRLKDLDLKRVAADVVRSRSNYYETRLSGLGPALPLARRLLEDWEPKGVVRERAADDAHAQIARLDAARRERLRAAGVAVGEDLVDAMMSGGLLAKDAEGDRWRCLIPSLRQYALTGTFRTASPPDLKRGGVGE